VSATCRRVCRTGGCASCQCAAWHRCTHDDRRDSVARQVFSGALCHHLDGPSLSRPARRERGDLEAIVMRVQQAARPLDSSLLIPRVL